jgi:hypothetical protein
MKISISAIGNSNQTEPQKQNFKYCKHILEHLQQGSVYDHEKIFLTSKFYLLTFSNPPISLKMGLQMGGRLLIATHLDQSNYLANQKQGVVNKYDFTVFIKLFQGSSRALKAAHFFRVTAVLVTPLGCTSSKISSARSHSECRWRCS